MKLWFFNCQVCVCELNSFFKKERKNYVYKRFMFLLSVLFVAVVVFFLSSSHRKRGEEGQRKDDGRKLWL